MGAMADSVLELDRFTVLANSPRILTKPSAGANPELRRVGCFMAIDESGTVIAFRSDEAPALRPDFEIFTSGEATEPLLHVAPDGEAQAVRAPGADGELLGRLRPFARGPLFARGWRLEDAQGEELARLTDRTGGAALARRWRRARAREALELVPVGGGPAAYLMREPTPDPYVLRVVASDGLALDRRLLLACALTVPALDGLTDYLRPQFKL